MPAASDLRPPRQARSRATLERLTRAAEALLEDRPFERLTVSDIVARAGSSTGAFYARFRDKEALLLHLDERFVEQTLAVWREHTDPARWEGRTLAELVRHFVTLLVRKHRDGAGVLRGLVLYARSRGDQAFVARARRMNREVIDRLAALLLTRRRAIAHPHPEEAVRFGLLTVVATVREAILFGDGGTFPDRYPDAVLAEELARTFLAYLTTPGGRPR